MKIAVANRPIEKFQTEVTLPEWQLEPDEEAYFGNADETELLDENGQPIGPDPTSGPPPDVNPDVEVPQKLDQKWVDGVLGRDVGTPPPPKPMIAPKPSAPAPKPKPPPVDDQAFPRPNQ
jgi:penicillin-binding protein 1A